MLDTFNAVWTALTTTNEELIKVLSIPCNFIEITVTMLLFTTLLKIETTRKQRIIYVIFLSLLGILTTYFIPAPFNIFINIVSLPIAVFFIFKTSILKSVLSGIIPMIICYILETIFFKIYFIILGISKEQALSVPIYRLLFIMINYSCWIILYKIFKDKKINITILDSMDKRTKILLIINSIFMLCSFVLQLFLLSYFIDNLPVYITLISVILLLGYYFISFYSIIKTTNLQQTKQILEQTQQYNKTLCILHDNIRCFKHDYNNMITIIGRYIQSEDIEGLKKYYSQLLSDCSRSNNLSTLSPEVINEPAVYSLLTNKYYKANELGIEVNIEAFLDFHKLDMKIYEFTKILGILLDNAIEAAQECEKKVINVTICKDFNVNRQLLVIENTYKNKSIDTEKIYEKGFSSKQNNTGLGLWETRQILKRNNNLNLFTTKNSEFFKQQLEIYC